jgi:hypothetical protein
MTNSITIQFNNQTITAFLHNDTPVVALKPIVENIGLVWGAQFNRIQRHPVLSSTISMMNIVAEDGKNREMLCLPLDMLNGWLFGIDANRVKPELKDRVIIYQRECFKVLANHFGLGQLKRNVLTTEQARFIQESVNAMVHKTGKHWNTIYHDIKTVFRIDTYKEATQEQFPELCKYLGTVYEGEHIPAKSESAIPDDKVVVSRSWLEGVIQMTELQRDRFHLVEQAEEQIQHAFNLLSVMVSGHMKQANDAIREARYRMHDPITHAKSYASVLKGEIA